MNRMKISTRSFVLFFLVLLLIPSYQSCTDHAHSKGINLRHKAAPPETADKDKGKIVAKIEGKFFTEDELFKDVETKIYELETQIYQLKLNSIKWQFVEMIKKKDPKHKGMSRDEFLESLLLGKGEVSDEELKQFLSENGLEYSAANEQQKTQGRQILEYQKKKKVIEDWIAIKSKKSPIEIYGLRPERPKFIVDPGDSPSFGKKGAPVTIVEFSDFQCPFCAKAVPIINKIKEKYSERVRIVFKNYPLPSHRHAFVAAKAATCADRQGKFWELHDQMYQNQVDLSTERIKILAKGVGINGDELLRCMGEQEITERVQSDVAQGKKIGVQSTPMFFINGKILMGASSFEEFAEIIEEELEMSQ